MGAILRSYATDTQRMQLSTKPRQQETEAAPEPRGRPRITARCGLLPPYSQLTPGLLSAYPEVTQR